ncbi:MAG: type II toxin-antitoxin system VapC family toxin [Bryobacterales bacterium]|nr:type II toxin-antitoxin system VapC family toxin [Bryobacterales bacterium]
MPVLIDSDILIEVSRRRDDSVIEKWVKLSQSTLLPICSPVTVAEIWHGARPNEYDSLDALFRVLECVSIDREIGRAAGEFMRQFGRSHAVELGDALIAATAVRCDALLWTRNRKHYPMKELKFF